MTTRTTTRWAGPWPRCDFCGEAAKIDGRTKHGPWAAMCQTHWQTHGVGRLGLGFGQIIAAAGGPPPSEAA